MAKKKPVSNKLGLRVEKHNGKPIAAYVKVSHNKVARTEEFEQGLLVDFDKDGAIVGIEIIGEFVEDFCKKFSKSIG